MKEKILIAGNQEAIIDDFYAHTENDFFCMTTSMRKADLRLHLQYFDPDAFVYCMGKDLEYDTDVIIYLNQIVGKKNAVFVVIGDKADILEIEQNEEAKADLMLSKPINIKKIQELIVKKIEDRRIEREVAERKMKEAQEKAMRDSKKHILVVDDDPIMLRTIKRYLEEEYVVATAPSGKFALKFLEQKHADLVLLDYEMPEMSGSTVMKHIREVKELENLPIVFLTGVSDVQKIKTVLAMQPNGYLLKPVEYERLHETINGILG